MILFCLCLYHSSLMVKIIKLAKKKLNNESMFEEDKGYFRTSPNSKTTH